MVAVGVAWVLPLSTLLTRALLTCCDFSFCGRMLIMGLKEPLSLARTWIEKLSFDTVRTFSF